MVWTMRWCVYYYYIHVCVCMCREEYVVDREDANEDDDYSIYNDHDDGISDVPRRRSPLAECAAKCTRSLR